MEDVNNPENTGENQVERDNKGRYVEGVSGNPAGKPKGAKNKFSFVNYWQERWDKDPTEFEDLATAFMKDDKLKGLIIQMIDGRPTQDITSAGEKIIPIPILDVPKDNSNKENPPAIQESKDSTRRDISQQNG